MTLSIANLRNVMTFDIDFIQNTYKMVIKYFKNLFIYLQRDTKR